MRRIVVRERAGDWVVLDNGTAVGRAQSRRTAKQIARSRARQTDSRPAVEIETEPGVWRTIAP